MLIYKTTELKLLRQVCRTAGQRTFADLVFDGGDERYCWIVCLEFALGQYEVDVDSRRDSWSWKMPST